MNEKIKKLVVAAMLTAIGFALSGFSFPIGASKCFPIQHLINVVSGVILGPAYSVLVAFCISVLRNLAGTGSLLAFPGSMVGAFLCGMMYKYTKKLAFAYIGEVFGTAVLGGMLCYPVATMLMGKEAALFAYVIPFGVSTLGGTCIAAILLAALYRSGAMKYLRDVLGSERKQAK